MTVFRRTPGVRCTLTGRRGASTEEATDSLVAAGRRPAMVLIERCERDAVEQREAHWIHYYRSRFQADLNRSIPRLLRNEESA